MNGIITLGIGTYSCLGLLKLFPVVHFLHGSPTVCAQWKDDDPVLNYVREKCREQWYVLLACCHFVIQYVFTCMCTFCSDFMSDYFGVLKELFDIDPLLPYIMIYICPMESLADLVHHLDLQISIAWLFHVANRKSKSQVCNE